MYAPQTMRLAGRQPAHDLPRMPSSLPTRGSPVWGLPLLASAIGAAEGPFLAEVEAGAAWQARNDVRIPSEGGTRFAIDDVADDEPLAVGRLRLAWDIAKRHRVQLEAAPLRIDGRGTLDAPVVFAGGTFAADVPTRSVWRFDTYRARYRWAAFAEERWQLGVGLTVLVRDAEVQLSQEGRVARDTDVGVVPLLHLDAAWRFAERWTAVVDGDGWAVSQGRAFDIAALVRWAVAERWTVAAGGRLLEGGADNDTVFTAAAIPAAVVVVGVRF